MHSERCTVDSAQWTVQKVKVTIHLNSVLEARTGIQVARIIVADARSLTTEAFPIA